MNKIKQVIILICMSTLIFSCTSKNDTSGGKEFTVVDVAAVYDSSKDQHLFRTDTDTIPSGWTTFRFSNASPVVHFMLLELMPGNRTSEDSEREVVPPFQDAMDLIQAGNVEEGMAKLGELPEWYSDVGFMGGPGFVSPGKSTETTVYLEPGNYVLECYVKTEDGTFHSSMGMVKDLRVTEDSTSVSEPTDPTLEINLSNEGIEVKGEIKPGKHLVAVHFNEEDPPLLGNDIQVVRLEDNTAIDSVAKWVDWSQPEGLVSSAENPAPAEFLGGTHEMPKGNTAYFTVELTPGNYAWISERPADNSMYKEFSVEAEEVTSN